MTAPAAPAAWSMARLAGRDRPLEPNTIMALRDAEESGGEGSDRCLQILARRVDPPLGRESILAWSAAPTTARFALTAAGILGDPAVIPWLIERFDAPPLARLAGEAFTTITGLAINRRPFEGQWPEGFIAGPTEDPEDEGVEMDPDENLPWPHRQAVADWWAAHCGDLRRIAVSARPAAYRRVARSGAAARVSTAAGRGGLGAGHPAARAAAVRGPRTGVPAATVARREGVRG